MMHVSQRRKQGQPTTCENCHVAILPGDQYYAWQTWNQQLARCLTCGVPPRNKVSISRLRPVYKLLESFVQYSYRHAAVTKLELHRALVNARKGYLANAGKHPHTPRGKDRQRRADTLTTIIQLLETAQDIKEFQERALYLLHTVDPLVVGKRREPVTVEVLPAWAPSDHQLSRIKTLRTSGYSNREIAKKLKLKEADVRRVNIESIN